MQTKKEATARRQREYREHLRKEGWVFNHVYVHEDDVVQFDETIRNGFFRWGVGFFRWSVTVIIALLIGL